MSFFEKKFPYNLGGRQRHVETSEFCRLNFIPKSALTESRWTYAVKSSLNEFLGKNIPELKYGSKHAKRDEGSDGKAFKWDGKNGAMGCRFIEFMILITYSNILQNTLCALFSISLSHFRAYSYEIHFILKDHFLKKVFFSLFFCLPFLWTSIEKLYHNESLLCWLNLSSDVIWNFIIIDFLLLIFAVKFLCVNFTPYCP